jgi:spermidine synthase/tetratricopeptide (TPR) repeat protein
MFDIEWLQEGIDGTVTVETAKGKGDALTGTGGDRRLAINGVNVAGTRIDFQTTQKLQAHLALLVRAGSERVLQVGFGSGGTAYSISRHPVKRIDCVELSRAVIAAAPQFEETNHGVLDDDRVHLHVEDARSYVKHAPHAYDVILSDSTHPILAGEGLLYSVDYLRDCAARLKPDGIFSTWLPIYGMRLAEVKVIVRSIREAFPYTYIWHTSVERNEWCIVHGMRQPLRIDYGRFAREAAIPEVRQDLAQIGLDSPDTLLALLLYDHEAVNKWLRDVDQLNTDDNGYLEFVGPRGARQFHHARTRNFLLTFPDLVLSAEGSILDYVVGPGGDGAPWRQRIRREVSANQHILAGRLYEFGRQDSYMLLARMEYQKALEVAPGHYVAQRMLGLAPRQIDWAREAARDKGASQMALDQLAAAETALGRLEEAAKWARQMARPEHRHPASGPVAIVALLRKDRDEMARILQERADEGGAAKYLGIPRIMFRQALDREDAVAAAPGDAQNWRQLGIIYREMAASIFRDSGYAGRRPLPALQIRSFRTQAVASLVSLARSRYEVALSLDPGDIAARHGLALVLGAQGEYREAAEVLEGIDRQSVEQAGAGVSSDVLMELAAALQEKERDPFGFIADVQRSMLEQVSEEHR